MNIRRWDTLTGAIAVLLLFFTAYGNALLLGIVSGALLVMLLGFRLFVARDGPRPSLLVAATVIACSLAIAIAWLVQRSGPS